MTRCGHAVPRQGNTYFPKRAPVGQDQGVDCRTTVPEGTAKVSVNTRAQGERTTPSPPYISTMPRVSRVELTCCSNHQQSRHPGIRYVTLELYYPAGTSMLMLDLTKRLSRRC